MKKLELNKEVIEELSSEKPEELNAENLTLVEGGKEDLLHGKLDEKWTFAIEDYSKCIERYTCWC